MSDSEARLIPVPLATDRLNLEPLSLQTTVPLCAATKQEPDIFRYLALDPMRPGALEAWISNAVKNTFDGNALHFILKVKQTGELIGHTAIVQINTSHRRCELAWTWLFRKYRGQGYACESKQALYTYLFDTCGFKRVQLLADQRNIGSVRSIERSGAKREGIMRNHQRTLRGDWRNTVVFSLTDEDWNHADTEAA
jgi:RimJ/RimL family protein N-acetyltransferase